MNTILIENNSQIGANSCSWHKTIHACIFYLRLFLKTLFSRDSELMCSFRCIKPKRFSLHAQRHIIIIFTNEAISKTAIRNAIGAFFLIVNAVAIVMACIKKVYQIRVLD